MMKRKFKLYLGLSVAPLAFFPIISCSNNNSNSKTFRIKSGEYLSHTNGIKTFVFYHDKFKIKVESGELEYYKYQSTPFNIQQGTEILVKKSSSSSSEYIGILTDTEETFYFDFSNLSSVNTTDTVITITLL